MDFAACKAKNLAIGMVSDAKPPLTTGTIVSQSDSLSQHYHSLITAGSLVA